MSVLSRVRTTSQKAKFSAWFSLGLVLAALATPQSMDSTKMPASETSVLGFKCYFMPPDPGSVVPGPATQWAEHKWCSFLVPLSGGAALTEPVIQQKSCGGTWSNQRCKGIPRNC